MSSPALARVVDAALEATVAGSFSSIGSSVRRRLDHWPDAPELTGTGRTVVITGANSGIGFAVARTVLRSGASVIALVRSDDKGRDTVERLSGDVVGDATIAYDLADLSDLASVRAVAARLRVQHDHLDGLVHNAGAMFDERGDTGDGLERTYQLHVVGPHLLTALLLDRLVAAPDARVVTVTSGGMYAAKLGIGRLTDPSAESYRPATAYAQAKRAQVVLTEQWAHRFGGRGIRFDVAHPGWVRTAGIEASLPGFARLVGPVLRDPEDGADTIAWLVVGQPTAPAGRLWHDRRPRLAHRVPWTVTDAAVADRLWTRVTRDAGIRAADTTEVEATADG